MVFYHTMIDNIETTCNVLIVAKYNDLKYGYMFLSSFIEMWNELFLSFFFYLLLWNFWSLILLLSIYFLINIRSNHRNIVIPEYSVDIKERTVCVDVVSRKSSYVSRNFYVSDEIRCQITVRQK